LPASEVVLAMVLKNVKNMGLFNNPWGKGSGEHDKWFKNPWKHAAEENDSVLKNDQDSPLDGTEKTWAWVPTNKWNDIYKLKFREYVAKKSFTTLGKWTCEDLALYLIIEFSYNNSLPFKWETGARSFDVTKNPDFYGMENFRNEVMSRCGASDFDRSQNTLTIDLDQLSPGDLILLDQAHDGSSDHVQVIVEVSTTIVTNSNSGYFRVTHAGGVQGENNRSIQSQSDRDRYSADPRDSNYIGSNLEYFFWNFKEDTYSNISMNQFYSNAKDLLRPKYVQFNFNAWN
jgi:hypothetical protein